MCIIPVVGIGMGEYGVFVSLRGKDGAESGGVTMYLDTHGGQVSFHGKGEQGGQARVGIDKFGGLVGVANKNGEPRAGMHNGYSQ